MDPQLKLTSTQSNLVLLIQVFWHTGLIRRKLREILLKHSDHEQSTGCLLCLLKESFTRLQKQAGIFTLTSDSTSFNDDELYIQKLNYIGRHSDLTDSYESILDTIRNSTFKDNSSINSSSSITEIQDFTVTFQHQRTSCQCHADNSSHTDDIDESVLPLDAHVLVRNIKDGQSMSESIQSILLSTESTICLDCNQQISVTKQVKSHPHIISVGLVWTEQVQTCIDKDITSILTVLQEETLSFSNNSHQDEGTEELELYITGVVCQFRQNYESYSYHTKRRDWINFTATQPPTQVGSDFCQVVNCILDREGLPVLLVFSVRQRGIGSNSSLDSQSLKMTHRSSSGARNGFYQSQHISYAQDLGLTQTKSQDRLLVGSLYPDQSQYPLYPGDKTEQVIYTSDYGSYSSQESNHSGNTLYSSLADCEEYMNQMKSQTPPYQTPPTNQSSHQTPPYQTPPTNQSSPHQTVLSHRQTISTHQNRPINDQRRNVVDDRQRGRTESRGRPPTVNRKEKPKPPPRRSSSHGRLPSRRQLEHENRLEIPSSYDDSILLKPLNSLNIHENGYPVPSYNRTQSLHQSPAHQNGYPPPYNQTQSPHQSPAHRDGPSYATLPRKKKTGPATPIKPPASTGAQSTWMKQVAQKGDILHKHKSLSNDHERKTPNFNDIEYINRNTVQKILQQQKRVTGVSRPAQHNSTNRPTHNPPPYQPHHSNQSSQSSHSSAVSSQNVVTSQQQSAAVWDYHYSEPAEPATQVIGVIEPNKNNNQAHGRQCSDETEFEFPPPPSESDILAISQMDSRTKNASTTQSGSAPKSCISCPHQNGVKPKIANKPARPMLKSKSVTFQLSENQNGTAATNSSTSNNEFIPPPPQFSTEMGYGDYELLSSDASCDNKLFQEQPQPHITKIGDQSQSSYSYNKYNQHNPYTSNSSSQYSYQPHNLYTHTYHTHQYSTEL